MIISIIKQDNTNIPVLGVPQVVELESFDNYSKRWDVGSSDDYAGSFKNDALLVTTKSAGCLKWVYEEIEESDDYEIETSAKWINGNNDRGYGLLWGSKDGDNCYFFHITSNGYYRIARYRYGKSYDLVPWTTSYAINPKEYNSLKIRKIGSKMQFSINNVTVNILPVHGFYGKYSGFYTDLGMSISYDYFFATKVEKPYLNTYKVDLDKQFKIGNEYWQDDSEGGYHSYNTDLGYVIDLLNNEHGVSYIRKFPFINTDNTIMEITCSFMNGNTNAFCGSFWGTEKEHARLGIMINPAGEYMIYMFKDNAEPSLIHKEKSDYIKTNAPNVLNHSKKRR